MPSFRFRLEKIRRLRRREEEDSARELVVLLNRRTILLNGIEELRSRMKELMERRAILQTGRIDIPSVKQNAAWIEMTVREEWRLAGQLRALDRAIELQREEVLERRKKRKVLDELRERRLEEYRLEESRRELREADDRPRKRSGIGIA